MGTHLYPKGVFNISLGNSFYQVSSVNSFKSLSLGIMNNQNQRFVRILCVYVPLGTGQLYCCLFSVLQWYCVLSQYSITKVMIIGIRYSWQITLSKDTGKCLFLISKQVESLSHRKFQVNWHFAIGTSVVFTNTRVLLLFNPTSSVRSGGSRNISTSLYGSLIYVMVTHSQFSYTILWKNRKMPWSNALAYE